MKIWEAILYGLIGGITELLPISFGGHGAILESAFNLSPLDAGSGYYIRAAVNLGVICAVILAFRGPFLESFRGFFSMLGGRKVRKGDQRTALRRRSISLAFFALVPMLLSLIYTAPAESIRRLPIVAIFFGINGLVLFFAGRYRAGCRTERDLMLSDTLLMGAGELAAVLPGLSPVSAGLCAGKFCGLDNDYSMRLTYLLLLGYNTGAFLYRIIRAAVLGTFVPMVLLFMLLTALCTAVTGYLAVQYFRYLMKKEKLRLFAYYNWEIGAIALILALINA